MWDEILQIIMLLLGTVHQVNFLVHVPPLLTLAMNPTPQASRSRTNGSGPSNMFCVSPSLR